MFLLICYDVEAGRTELFRKLLGMYLFRAQNSVFSGDLDAAGKRKLMESLKKIIVAGDDILIFEAKNKNNISCEKMIADGARNISSRKEDAATGGDWII